jgi:ATP-binding cassette subfamily B protein
MIPWWLRFAPLARGHSARIVGLAALAVVGVAFEALLPWPLKLIIDNVLGREPLPDPAQWLARLPGAQSPAVLLAWLALSVLLLFACVQGLQLAKGVMQADIASRLRLALAAQVFERLQALSLTYHRRARRGDLLRRVTADSGCLSTMVTEVGLPVFISGLSLVTFFAIMWHLDPALALVAVLVAVPMGILMRVLGPRMTERAYEHQEAEGAVWAAAEQALAAIPVVQGFARETHEALRFRSLADRSVRAYLRTLSSQIQFRLGIDGCEALGIAAIMLIGGYHAVHGTTSIGTLVVFLSYVAALYAPLLAFAYVAMTVASATGSARRVEQVLDAKDVVVEAAAAAPLRVPARRSARGHVRLERVVFGYEPGVPVLHEIELAARPGETLALVGATGAGKSTLVSLIPRLYDPWEGRVLIDGEDVRKATLASVRDAVAFVLQDPFLLPMSIAENIAYGRPSATRAQVEAAARLADAEEFIRRLPQQYDTLIGERGVTLSGGQRQRLSVARALLKDAPILIMDEPTSALDVATEHSMLDALAQLAAGRTTIVIAHRLSTVRRADRIAVLDRGTIAACGTHEELLAASGLYRMLFLSQATPEAAGAARAPKGDA